MISKNHFDGIDLKAYIGWVGGEGVPAMAHVYAEIREAWTRYIKKLCKVTT